MAILDFSVSGWHGFGSVTQVCFGISVSNFMCMSFVAVGRSLTIVSYVAFKMAALWFWTMPPSPMERGGILVDHWSTISSWFRSWRVSCPAPSHYLNQCWNILIGPLGTDVSEILIGTPTFSFKKMLLKMSSAKCHPLCIGLNVLTHYNFLRYIEMMLHPRWDMLYGTYNIEHPT